MWWRWSFGWLTACSSSVVLLQRWTKTELVMLFNVSLLCRMRSRRQICLKCRLWLKRRDVSCWGKMSSFWISSDWIVLTVARIYLMVTDIGCTADIEAVRLWSVVVPSIVFIHVQVQHWELVLWQASRDNMLADKTPFSVFFCTHQKPATNFLSGAMWSLWSLW